MTSPTLTEQLAAYWAPLPYDELPASVVHGAKRSLLDTLGAGIAGFDTEATAAIHGALVEAGGGSGGTAAIWGGSGALPPPQAALVNGTASHARELDDFGGCGHDGAVVVPAVMAVANHLGADGRTVLAAIAAGYDISGRVMNAAGGYRLHKERGWHSTGTCGCFGAAAGAAKVLGLDSERFAWALGIAGSFTGGTWAFLADGAMTKRYHPGRAAEIGVSAGLFARAGLTGPREVLEAKWGGFLPTYAGETARPELAIKDLGTDFRILQNGVKLYACCRGIHSSLDALFDLMSEGKVARDTVESFVVHGVDQTRRQLGGRRIDNILDAQFSLPYSLAVAVDSGRATLDQFWPPRADDPAVRDLMARTEVVADGVIAFGEEPLLEVRRRDGEIFRRHVTTPKGAPENPVTDAELRDKARSLMAPILGQAGYQAVRDAIDDFESLRDVRPFCRLLQPSAEARQ